MIDINPQFKQALDRVAKGQNLFVTGRAGTGKSNLLRHLRETCRKQLVVLAPTGIAALNVQGQTLHSFFNLPHRIILPKELSFASSTKLDVMKHLELLIIDEISMVRADVLDGINYILKVVRKCGAPFGGVQVAFFGDLHQLAPIVNKEEGRVFNSLYATPYFFSARCYAANDIQTVELQKMYRQTDDVFIDVLNHIRDGQCSAADLKILNAHRAEKPDTHYVNLTTTNAIARAFNMKKLNELKTRMVTYTASRNGNFDESSYPTDYILALRPGAQVMFVKNDSPDKRWVNGTIGIVESLNDNGVRVNVDGTIHDVEAVTWEKIDYQHGSEGITSSVAGTFTQIPLKLAWAITIHKSQGQTFDNVVINLGSGSFCHGQTYVAMSRCTSLDGMVFARPVTADDVIFDERVMMNTTEAPK